MVAGTSSGDPWWSLTLASDNCMSAGTSASYQDRLEHCSVSIYTYAYASYVLIATRSDSMDDAYVTCLW